MNKNMIVLAVMMLAMAAGTARAADHKWSLALLGGMIAEEKRSGVTIDEGMLAGVEITRTLGDTVNLSFGFSFMRVEKESSALPGVKVKFNDYFGPLCAAYKFDGALKGLYLGPQVAIVTRSYVKENDDIGLTSLGYGARLGYDYPLSERFSVGAQGNYLKVGSAEKTVTGDGTRTTYSVGETSFTNLLLSVKYHFW